MRIEFVINNAIRIHPMALVDFDKLKDTAARAEIKTLTATYPSKPEYFVNQLTRPSALWRRRSIRTRLSCASATLEPTSVPRHGPHQRKKE